MSNKILAVNLRNILLILILSSMLGLTCHAQERLFLQCDRYFHLADDTLWWKADLVRGGDRITNLHAELRSAKGALILHELFPVMKGQSVGQIYLPDSLGSAIYWLRLYTGGVSATVPITVYQEADRKMTLIANGIRRENSLIVTLTKDTLSSDPGGYNSWRLDIGDTVSYHYSCSVTDASLPADQPLPVSDSLPAVAADTGYLSWTGKALKPNGKQRIKGDALMTMLVKDSTLQMSRVLPVTADGSFQLNGLFFFGKAQLLYQVNKTGKYAKEVKMVPDSISPPRFALPTGWVSRDTVLSQQTVASAIASDRQQGKIRVSARILKEVEIRGWVSPRKKLDSVYTTGVFSEPALYAFDLRNEKYNVGLGEYLQMHLFTEGGNGPSDPPKYPNHPLLFYVNEELKTWDQIGDMSIGDIAYIKAMESDFIGNDPFTKFVTGVGGFTLGGGGGGLGVPKQETPMVVMIYTRKGKDIKKVPGLNELTLMGYTPIARFTPEANGSTLVWVPLIDANHIRLRFYNDYAAKRFRLTIHGVSDSGKEIYYTAVLPN